MQFVLYSFLGVLFLGGAFWPVLAQDRQPGAVNLDAPTCEDRLLASRRGLVNVALQVTDLEAQVEHWRKRVEALVKERDAALAKVKSDEQQSQLTKDK